MILRLDTALLAMGVTQFLLRGTNIIIIPHRRRRPVEIVLQGITTITQQRTRSR